MKKSIIFLMIFALSSAGAQDEIFSFFFKKDALYGLSSVNNVNPILFGKYELTNTSEHELRRAAGEYLMADASGIYIEKNRLLSMDREEIRENSKYRVSGGWLHGVVENDSVPCALDGEKYFFLVPAKTYLFDNSTPSNRLIQITQSKYALFSIADNGHFSVVVANFLPGACQMMDIVFSMKDPNNIEKIEKKEEELTTDEDIKTYLLTPSKEEWNSFIFKKCLETYDAYSRVMQ